MRNIPNIRYTLVYMYERSVDVFPNRRDLAYFDGLKEVILGVGIVIPKPNIFQDHIQYLLCLTTPQEIVILGVSFAGTYTCIYM